jgi:ABC-type nitrate/sulfonate/bicarbonate transport system permease component
VGIDRSVPSITTEGLRPEADGLIYGLTPPRSDEGFLVRHPSVIRVASVLVVLVAWELYGRALNPVFLSYPIAIARALVELIRSGELLQATLQTLRSLVIGFAIALVVGIGIGFLMGRYRLVSLTLDPFVTALYNTPSVALIPLIQLWFGLGVTAKIIIVSMSAFFPIVINTFAGVHNTSQGLVDVVRAYGATARQISTKVVLPNSVPFIMAGVRLAVGRAVIGVVTAEFFTAISGLGGLVIVFSNAFATAKLFVPVLTLIALGLCLTSLAKWAERRLTPWKESERAAAR